MHVAGCSPGAQYASGCVAAHVAQRADGGGRGSQRVAAARSDPPSTSAPAGGGADRRAGKAVPDDVARRAGEGKAVSEDTDHTGKSCRAEDVRAVAQAQNA